MHRLNRLYVHHHGEKYNIVQLIHVIMDNKFDMLKKKVGTVGKKQMRRLRKGE